MATCTVNSSGTSSHQEFADINALHLAPLCPLDLRDLLAKKTEQREMLEALRINAAECLRDAAAGDSELMDELIQDMQTQCAAVLAELLKRLATADGRNTCAVV